MKNPFQPYRRILLFLILSVLLWASPSSADSESKPKKSYLGLQLETGYGYETNVFFSESKRQSDTFILSELIVSGTLKPFRNSLLFMDLFGSHQSFQDYSQANRTFGDAVIDGQFFITSSTGIGLSNTLSYTNLKLFDTDGNPLPKEKFRSLSDRGRLYGFFYPSSSLGLELGGWYRRMNVGETEDQPSIPFPSLDFEEVGIDLSSRYYFTPRFSARAKYTFSRMAYDELQAFNRTTSFDNNVTENNPLLRLRRHELLTEIKYKKKPSFDLRGTVKLRLNEDQFENHLSYHQGEVKTWAELGNPEIVRLFLKLSYKVRNYTDRKRGIGFDETRKEDYLIATARLTQRVTKWLEAYLSYQWIHKSTNVVLGDFTDQSFFLGLRFIW